MYNNNWNTFMVYISKSLNTLGKSYSDQLHPYVRNRWVLRNHLFNSIRLLNFDLSNSTKSWLLSFRLLIQTTRTAPMSITHASFEIIDYYTFLALNVPMSDPTCIAGENSRYQTTCKHVKSKSTTVKTRYCIEDNTEQREKCHSPRYNHQGVQRWL